MYIRGLDGREDDMTIVCRGYEYGKVEEVVCGVHVLVRTAFRPSALNWLAVPPTFAGKPSLQ